MEPAVRAVGHPFREEQDPSPFGPVTAAAAYLGNRLHAAQKAQPPLQFAIVDVADLVAAVGPVSHHDMRGIRAVVEFQHQCLLVALDEGRLLLDARREDVTLIVNATLPRQNRQRQN